ncbi:MAG: hypothetical protein Q4D78_10100 [Neisseria zoodegmatis]|uniref:hypothetical protein n=1 Tax=Neisseria zoodegmatis TaxID=326523 RepID=UPI0026ED06CC|nr:hypothetical protein [Neisseria zoodegmatis]MDO5070521.1 hypothetical protein [Neisseria zoodegmatis]
MSDQIYYYVPRTVSVGNPQEMADKVHRFLAQRGLIEPELQESASYWEPVYPCTEHLRSILQADTVAFLDQHRHSVSDYFQGLFFVTEPTFFTPAEGGGSETVICPECHAETDGSEDDEAFGEMFAEFDEENPVLVCGQCGHTAEINQFDFRNGGWAYSDFGIGFLNADNDTFTAEFEQQLAEAVGYPLAKVERHI